MTAEIALEERLAGAVWGHLVGDAVGVPYEFTSARSPETVVFGASGSHHQPPGTWSDDGAPVLAFLDSLLAAGFDTTDQAERALAWYRDKAYTPNGDGLFDIGGTTGEALRAIGAGTPAEEAGPTHQMASGNGSLMRILPLALVDQDIPDTDLVERAHRASKVTHGTAPAQVACALYSLVARRLLSGQGGQAAALADARQALREIYETNGSAGHLAALDHLEAYPNRGGRGRVWDSFWSAWDAFDGATDYRETIQRAVAYGNDTDTTAAIAGGLAGIRWGIGGIPAEWLSGMRGREIVEPLVAGLTKPENPIRVDWVDLTKVPDLSASPGRLGMTFLPGKKGIGITGEHDRDLLRDVRWLRLVHGVDAFLLLVEDKELSLLGVSDIADVMAAEGIEVFRHPIQDTRVPTDRAALAETLDTLHTHLAKGETVVVACRGGLGRTGTVVACLLKGAGLDADAAISLTRANRHGTIENADQERFVRSWELDPASANDRSEATHG